MCMSFLNFVWRNDVVQLICLYNFWSLDSLVLLGIIGGISEKL